MKTIEKLRKIREDKKISRREVAENLNISSSLLNEIENDRTRLSLDLFVDLCNFYNVNPSSILDDNNENLNLTNQEIETIKNSIVILNKILEKAKRSWLKKI